MKKESLYEKLKKQGGKGSEYFEPKFSWRLRIYAWLSQLNKRLTGNSSKSERTKFHKCEH